MKFVWFSTLVILAVAATIGNCRNQPREDTPQDFIVVLWNKITSPTPTTAATTEDPEATTEDPEATTEDPEATTEDPEATTDDPTTTPIIPTEDPEATTEDPEATTEDPEATTEDPEATTDDPTTTPIIPTEDPEATTEDPEATTDDPEATTEDPEATTDDPEATTEDPEATTDDPEATTDDPTTTPIIPTEDPEATTEDPEATTDDPEATTEDPEATTDDPTTTPIIPTEDPEATTEDPEATTDDPEATTEDPEATTEDPEATTEDPPTTPTIPTEDPNGGKMISSLKKRRSTWIKIQNWKSISESWKIVTDEDGAQYVPVCTGTILSERNILTTASCAAMLNVDSGYVGSTASVPTLKIARIVPYSGYSSNTHVNNMAIVKTELALYESDAVTMNVPVAKDYSYNNASCRSFSWDINAEPLATFEDARSVVVCRSPKYGYRCAAQNENEAGAPSIDAKSREGAVLVCDNQVAGIYSQKLYNDVNVAEPMEFQDAVVFSRWIDTVINSAHTAQMSLAVFLTLVAFLVVMR